MNYNSLLDPFFSSFWLSFGTLGGLLLVGLIFRKPLFVNRKQKLLLGALYFILFMLGFFTITLINPMCLGYGKAIGVNGCLLDKKLYVMDYRLAGGGEGEDPDPYYRVHVIDPVSGEKKFRFLVGSYSELLLVTNDALVCRRSNEVVFFSINDGKELAVWNEETLPKLFPELASGIDNFSPHLQDSYYLNVTALDGNSYRLFVPEKRIWGEKPAIVPVKNSIEVNESYIRINDRYRLSLGAKQWSDKRKKLYLPNDSLANPSLSFIEGKFIAFGAKDSTAVILHYETTEKLGWILTGVSADGKKQSWEIRRAALRNDPVETEQEFAWTTDEGKGLLFFTAQDETFCIREKDGQLLWRTPL